MQDLRPLPLDVAVVGFDGCMTSAITGLCDIAQVANEWAVARSGSLAGAFKPRIVSMGSNVVAGSAGFTIPATPIDQSQRPDLVIVPPIVTPVPETIAQSGELVAWLRSLRGTIVASVCGGAFFLAEAGLLAGRRATTNPALAGLFRGSYPDVSLEPEERLIDTGDVLTAGSTTAFLDLGVYLVDRFVGREVAVLTAKALCIDANRRSQLPYCLYIAPKNHGDEAVLSVQQWLEQGYKQKTGLDALAKRARMSERSLSRRFVGATGLTPVEYLHRVRIEAAKHLLETSMQSVAEITDAVGYQDARSFSRLFRKLTDVGPCEYRDRFGLARGA